jgi:hypothetical protein
MHQIKWYHPVSPPNIENSGQFLSNMIFYAPEKMDRFQCQHHIRQFLTRFSEATMECPATSSRSPKQDVIPAVKRLLIQYKLF